MLGSGRTHFICLTRSTTSEAWQDVDPGGRPYRCERCLLQTTGNLLHPHFPRRARESKLWEWQRVRGSARGTGAPPGEGWHAAVRLFRATLARPASVAPGMLHDPVDCIPRQPLCVSDTRE